MQHVLTDRQGNYKRFYAQIFFLDLCTILDRDVRKEKNRRKKTYLLYKQKRNHFVGLHSSCLLVVWFIQSLNDLMIDHSLITNT